MKYWGTLPLPPQGEILQDNYGSEGWGFESLQACEPHEEFHDFVRFLFGRLTEQISRTKCLEWVIIPTLSVISVGIILV